MVVASAVGAVGLVPTYRALEAGKDVALANKETLVMAGELMVAQARARGARLLPIDSEHCALHQCLDGRRPEEVRRLVLTASGGPFRNAPAETFAHVTREEALNHPTWNMGRKITIDSATLMNKGLEVIEARWLFGVPPRARRGADPPAVGGALDGGVRGRHGAGAARGHRHAPAHPVRAELSRALGGGHPRAGLLEGRCGSTSTCPTTGASPAWAWPTGPWPAAAPCPRCSTPPTRRRWPRSWRAASRSRRSRSRSRRSWAATRPRPWRALDDVLDGRRLGPRAQPATPSAQGPRRHPHQSGSSHGHSGSRLTTTTAAFVAVLGLIIFFHEFGHFITAKAFGMRVFIFSFGFGRRLVGFKWGDTDCRVSPHPPRAGTSSSKASPKTTSARTRAAWATARTSPPGRAGSGSSCTSPGPFMNGVLTVGVLHRALHGRLPGGREPATTGRSSARSRRARRPAGRGLQPGDEIVAIDGKTVSTWEEAQYAILIRPDADAAGAPAAGRSGARGEARCESTASGADKVGTIGVSPLVRVGRSSRASPPSRPGSGWTTRSSASTASRCSPSPTSPLVAAPKDKPAGFEVWRDGQVLRIAVTPADDGTGAQVGSRAEDRSRRSSP